MALFQFAVQVNRLAQGVTRSGSQPSSSRRHILLHLHHHHRLLHGQHLRRFCHRHLPERGRTGI